MTEPAQVKAIMNGPLAAASVSISNLDDCGLEAFICREGAHLCFKAIIVHFTAFPLKALHDG